MEQQREIFQIQGNRFQDVSSEFVLINTLNTSSSLTMPYYALINCTTTGIKDHTILGIKSSKTIALCNFKGQEFKDHSLLTLDGNMLEQHPISCFTWRREPDNSYTLPSMIIGYQSGLISHVNQDKKLLNTFNYEERDRIRYYSKNQQIIAFCVLPDTNEDEFIALFADSSVIKYKLSAMRHNLEFMEKLKNFELKINFKEHEKPKQKSSKKDKEKEKGNTSFSFGRSIMEHQPEFSYFYARNDSLNQDNPRSFYRYNQRTISDIIVKKHISFSKVFKRPTDKETTVLAFVSFDGYLIIYEWNQMEPLLSYKSKYGGFNSLAFNENCDRIVLSGQDDCITVLDLNTMKTLRCEGHQSFVSRAIFHTISPQLSTEEEETKKLREILGRSVKAKQSQAERVIGGGLDGNISFWEYDNDIFDSVKTLGADLGKFPVRLNQHVIDESIYLKPLFMWKLKEAIGTIDLCSNFLFVSDQSGVITVYVIRDITRKAVEDESSPLKRRKGSETTRDEETITSENTWSRHKDQRANKEEKKENYLPRLNGENSERKMYNSQFTNNVRDSSSLLSRKKPN